ncbi:uncharacterized protein LOC143035275 isoform X2 [Oratosquilla oratoria]|uniref:uncharacterized protein LOC143035275 isoform X2 n=1 Tax=Oratosquilla oratoria TaxID=337810 RepID=UPI003F76C275
MQRGGEEDQWQKGPFGHFLMNHHITHNHMTPHDHHITHNHMTPHDHHMPRDHHIAPHDHMAQHDHHISSHDHMSSDNRHHHQRQQFENYVSSQPWSLTSGHHHHLTTTPPPQPQQPPPGLVSTHHPNQGSTGPSLDYVGASLGPARSYSVSQDILSDMNIARSPLLRSSSDLGIRLKQYQTGTYSEGLDGILDSSLDSVDGTQGLDSAFFPDVSPQRVLPSSSTPPAPPPPTSPSNKFTPTVPTSCTSSPSTFPPSPPAPQSPVSLASPASSSSPAAPTSPSSPTSPTSPGTQASPFSFYPSDREHVVQGMSHNITSKLHNFTESLGVLFSPLDHFSAHPPSPGKSSTDTFGDGGVHSQHPESGAHVTNASSLPAATATSCRAHPIKPEVQQTSPGSKPSYSDVLSKNTTQNFTVPPVSSVSPSPTTEINAGIPSKAEVPPMAGISRSATSRPKHRVGAGNNTSGTKAACKSGNHSPASRVGLDEFEVSSSTSQPLDEWLDMENLVINAVQSSMQSQPMHSNSSSPAHSARKAKKSEVKKQQQQHHHHNQALADQLNNKVSSAQPRQAPRRTSYINNILNVPSSSPTCNPSSYSPTSTTSANNSMQYTLPNNSCGPTVTNSNNGNDHSDGIVNNKAENGRPRPKEERRSCEDPMTCPMGGNSGCSKQLRNKPTGVSNNASSRGERSEQRSSKDNSKRSTNNRRKKNSPFTHADLACACWSVTQRWLDLVVVFVLWLCHLVFDVSIMSSRLLLHLLHITLYWSIEKWRNFLGMVKYYTGNLAGYFRWNRSEEKKITGRGERKSSKGLDCNIGLPTTGEEAMKRLLACRGKDPYSILGVTRDANDDDIKKYYKRQAILVHPDKNKQPGAEEAFKILAHAFELIGQPERRCEYDAKLEEETQMEGAWGELASLLTRLQEKLEEAANTIRCTNCNKRHRRTKLPRPIYAARLCNDCNIHHASREGDIWAESVMFGLRWRYYACMEGAVYDISEWAACQSENLKHLQANTHSVQYRIVSGKKTPAGKNSINDFPSDPDLEEFFNNLCREKFGKNYTPPSSSTGQHNQQPSDARKRKGKKKK